jgi:hypothetical protein
MFTLMLANCHSYIRPASPFARGVAACYQDAAIAQEGKNVQCRLLRRYPVRGARGASANLDSNVIRAQRPEGVLIRQIVAEIEH